MQDKETARVYIITIKKMQQFKTKTKQNKNNKESSKRLRPHVSGDFCIRNFFLADSQISASTCSVYESYTTVHTYPIRIRTSQRISQQVLIAYTKTHGYERPNVSGYTAYTEIFTLESVYRKLRIHRAYTADTRGRYVYPHRICRYKNLRVCVDGAGDAFQLITSKILNNLVRLNYF